MKEPFCGLLFGLITRSANNREVTQYRPPVRAKLHGEAGAVDWVQPNSFVWPSVVVAAEALGLDVSAKYRAINQSLTNVAQSWINKSIKTASRQMMRSQDAQRQQIRFRGRSYVAFVFSPIEPIVGWLEEIDATLARSPAFFVGRPVVLDLSAVDLSQSDIAKLISNLEARKIRVLGLEGADASCLNSELPPLLTGGRQCVVEQSEPKKPEAKAQPTSLLLDSPVRSGQSVVFTEGDVTVLGSVSSGAEIVAGGSIHVYGTLRGRAIAGAQGNSAARIYCQKIEAELLAIDGYYRTAEDIDATLRNRPAQAWLDGDIMRIRPLN